MTTIECDFCHRRINANSAGFITVITRQGTTPREQDFCSRKCHEVWARNHTQPLSPADFAAARDALNGVGDREARIDTGEYGVAS